MPKITRPAGLLVVAACIGFVTLQLALTRSARGQVSRSVVDGVYTEGQADRGQAFYVAKCQHCHMVDMQGQGTETPAIGGRAFVAKWQGKTLAATYEYILQNMPFDAPLRSLDPHDCADVIAYILKRSEERRVGKECRL